VVGVIETEYRGYRFRSRLEALSKRKLIRAVEYHVSESRYVITDAGRAALAEAEGGER
jgi:hypothetical protein